MDPITEPIPNEQNDNNDEEQIEQIPKKKEFTKTNRSFKCNTWKSIRTKKRN